MNLTPILPHLYLLLLSAAPHVHAALDRSHLSPVRREPGVLSARGNPCQSGRVSSSSNSTHSIPIFIPPTVPYCLSPIAYQPYISSPRDPDTEGVRKEEGGGEVHYINHLLLRRIATRGYVRRVITDGGCTVRRRMYAGVRIAIVFRRRCG